MEKNEIERMKESCGGLRLAIDDDSTFLCGVIRGPGDFEGLIGMKRINGKEEFLQAMSVSESWSGSSIWRKWMRRGKEVRHGQIMSILKGCELAWISSEGKRSAMMGKFRNDGPTDIVYIEVEKVEMVAILYRIYKEAPELLWKTRRNPTKEERKCVCY